ncbi:hypothetical protein BG011_005558 [Mortierella polycephala]|uniref:CID domain-containing protein n=1 Tax=Mortierella polycephala TaxID=41804 RepID=A0A9P6PYC5_9FUNG|nr:hypothetical protein BG011_005558 [Mortierella polycephala]
MLQKQQAMVLNPNDQASAKQVAILQQLETIVKTTQLTPENANMIRQQLAQLWTPAPTSAPAPSSGPGLGIGPSVPPAFPPGSLSQGMTMPMPSSPMPPNMMMMAPPQHPTIHQLPSSGSIPPIPPFLGMVPPHFAPHMQPVGSIGLSSASMPMMPVSTIPGATAPLPMSMSMPMPMPQATLSIPAPPAAANLLANLMQSGLLGPNGALAGQFLKNTANMTLAPQSPMIPAVSPTPQPAVVMPRNNANLSTQGQGVMSIGLIELTSQDIQRRRPAAIQIMYGTPPLQCNQCGYRCPKSDDAQKKMDSHLDWHFRQNRRMKDKAKKSHSRSWLVGEEDWIHSREGDLGQGQQPVFFDFGSGVNKTSKDEQALQEEIAALSELIVPETTLIQGLRGDEANTITEAAAINVIAKGCSICKEKFIKVWNEAEEEWSYKNAAVVEKMIYHATCHADLVRSNQRQAALAEAALAEAVAAANEASIHKTPLNSLPSSTNIAPNNGESRASIPMNEADSKIKMEHTGAYTGSPSVDQEMTAVTFDMPNSLKRKLEDELEEQNQLVSKKTILDQTS